MAMRALAANKLRSVLTMLGIIIGVGAVIALMSIGRGVQKYVTDQFAGLGSNLLFVAPASLGDGPPRLRRRQLELLTIGDVTPSATAATSPMCARPPASTDVCQRHARNGKDLQCRSTPPPQISAGARLADDARQLLHAGRS